MQEISQKTQKHVAALAFPFSTHAAPLLNLIRRLSLASPAVKFSFFSTAQSNNSLFKENDKNECIKPYNVHDGLPEGYIFRGNRMEPTEYFLQAMPGNFKSAMADAEAETGIKISCVITDGFFGFGAQMAEEMDVPWVPFWTAGPHPLLLHVDTGVIRQHMEPNGPADQNLDFLPGFSKIRAVDVPVGIISGESESIFSMMLHEMGQMLPQAAAVATNSFEELDPVVADSLKSKLKKFLNVGRFDLTYPPPRISDEHKCLDWLDRHQQASVVYISFGTSIQPPPPEIVALAEALEESGVPFLWSFRANADETLPKGFIERTSERGKIVPWTPQSEVLSHSSVGVFVSHCGWNSVQEAVHGAVPMICRPFFGDQQLNRRITEAVWETGIGLEGDRFTKEGTMIALERILSSEQGKKMKERVLAKKELALKAAQPDGSCAQNFKNLVEIITQ